MNIAVIGIEPNMRISIVHLLELFFETTDIQFPDTSDGWTGFVLDVNRKRTESKIFVEVTLAPAGIKRANSERTDCSLSPDMMKKAERRLVHITIFELLQQYTGIRPPWGILTGIRPTKLLHRLVQEGYDREEALRHLHDQYRIDPGKLTLMDRIVTSQHSAVPDLYQLKREVSLYIGIPFCPTKCAYCTFPAYAIGANRGSVDRFLHGLHAEMQAIGEWLKKNKIGITSIYFGGGTPTSIEAEQMDELYERMVQVLPMENVREITVEAGRPDTITEEKLSVLRKWNIDRISINPQTYTQRTLDVIGRHHRVEETIEKFHLARQFGFNNINMDLIIGLPGETIDDFEATLAQTEKLMPESLTVHTLAYKRASEMTKNKDKYPVANARQITQMMNLAATWTQKAGYEPYYLYRQKNILGNLENIGFAKVGKESIYNIMIMEEMQTIIGIGSGAASKWIDPVSGRISRFANPKDPKTYNETVGEYTTSKINALESLFSSKSATAMSEPAETI